MERQEKLLAFIRQYDNVNFNSTNIPKVLETLERADKDGCLKEFFLNRKPYRSTFPFFVFNESNKAARGKDQCAIVFALNWYSVLNPGFALRLNTVLKELARGSAKEAAAVFVLRNAQLELQELEISLVDFLDKELLKLLNVYVSKNKVRNILFGLLCIFGGALGAPGLAIAGMPVLSPFSAGVMIYGWVKVIPWCFSRPMSDEKISMCAREVRQYVE